MKVKIIILLCIYNFVIMSCIDRSGVEKNNHLGSSSISKSMELGVYISHIELISDDLTCEIDSLQCWMEFAWTPKYSLFKGGSTNTLDFYNVYIDLNGNYNEILFRESKDKKWRTPSFIVEPGLGYYLQLDKNTDLESVEFRLVAQDKDCFYRFVKVN